MAVEMPYDAASSAVLETVEDAAAEVPSADPAVLGLLAFSVGGTVLVISLLGYVSPVAQGGSVMPIVLAATGLGVFITTLWSAMLGQSFVAATHHPDPPTPGPVDAVRKLSAAYVDSTR